MYHLQRKCKPDAVKRLLAHTMERARSRSLMSVPLFQSPHRTCSTDIHATGHQYTKDAGELELDLPDKMDLCLHHEQGTATVGRSGPTRAEKRMVPNHGLHCGKDYSHH